MAGYVSSRLLGKEWIENFDGVVWFRRSLEIPAEWIGKPLKLNLGMIDDEDITYFNGVEIARGQAI